MNYISDRLITTSLPPEFQLLVICSRTQMESSLVARLETLVENEMDWSKVLAYAKHQGVMPLLQHHLNKVVTANIPATVLDELSTYARNNTAHNLVLSHLLLQILTAFEQGGISAVPYKGPALASSAYGNISLRSFKDLDVIVRPQDFKSAAAVLHTLGYTSKIKDPEGHFHASLRNPDTGVLVELHHDIIQRRYFPSLLEPTAMWDELIEAVLLGRRVASFAPEDTLLLLCLHGSSHAWQGLTWICDVAEYIRAHPALNWERMLQKGEQAQLTSMILLGLQLAYLLLGTPLPEQVRLLLAADPKLLRLSHKIIARMHKTPEVLNEAALTQRHLALRSGLANRLPLYRRLVTFLLHPNAKDRAWVHFPARWQAAYYFVRPLRLASFYIAQKVDTVAPKLAAKKARRIHK